jgi:hypothetical protein
MCFLASFVLVWMVEAFEEVAMSKVKSSVMTVQQLVDLVAFLHTQYTVAPKMLYP